MYKVASIFIIVILLVGFRWSPGMKWDVSRDQPIVWLDLDEEFYSDGGFEKKSENLSSPLARSLTR